VPDELLDAVHLIGSADQIRHRLQAWKEAGRKGWVHTMQIGTSQTAALELLAEELL
jgi:alkanesulfonate monooxygenase SsuD/methylene tetrahydromethanopterin reductase-like flavin-dependent oxidoreductase (luciferase family)